MDVKAIERVFRRYAKERGIELHIDKSMSLDYAAGLYNGWDRLMVVHSYYKKDPEYFLYLLAHECGHAIDFEDHTKRQNTAIYSAYGRLFTKGSMRPTDRKVILDCEKRADKLGKTILNDLDLDFNSDLYYNSAKGNLENYKDDIKLVLKKRKTNDKQNQKTKKPKTHKEARKQK